MGRPVDILLIGRNKIWGDMLVSPDVSLLKKICNFYAEPVSTQIQQIDAALLNAEGLSLKEIRKRIRTYGQVPIFIINAPNLSRLIKNHQNIAGVYGHEVSLYNCVRAIRFFVGRRMDLSSRIFQDCSLDVEENLIVAALKSGLSNKQIARKFDISLPAVKYYLQRIYDKLEVEEREEVAFKGDKIIV